MASPQEIRDKIQYQPKKASFFDAPVTKKAVTSTFNTLKSPAKIRELIAKSAGVVGDTTKSLVGQYGDFNAQRQQEFKDRNSMPKWMENTLAPFVSGVDTAKFIARETGAGVLSIGKTVDKYTRGQVYKNTQAPSDFSKTAEKKIFGREVGSVEDVYIKPAVKYAESKKSGGLEKFGLGILGGIVGMTVESPVGLPAKQPFKKLEKALLKELAESSDPLIIRDRLINYPEFRADSKFTDATVNLITKKKTPKEVREVIESARRIVELNDAKKAGVSEAPQVLITKNAQGKDVVFKVRPNDLETVRQAIKNAPITGKQPLLTTKPVNDLLSRGYVDGGTIGRAQVDSLTKKVDDLTGSIEDLTKPALRTPAEVRKAVAQGRTSDGKFTFKPNREAESARAGRAGAKTPSNLVARVSDLAENSLKNKADGGREKSIKYLRDNPDEVVSGEVRLREIEDGRIVIEDGRHRLQVASETGVTPKFLDVTAEYTGKPSARVADLISSKTESIVSGKEVSDLLKQQGSRGGVSDWLRGTVAKENYTKQRISIKELLAKDPDLKDYIEKSGGKLRPYNSTAKIPPIVTSKGEVWDGYNRIAQAIKNGDTDIEVLRGTSPKGVNPNAYALAGAPAGFEVDENGEMSFSLEQAMMGALGLGMIAKGADGKALVRMVNGVAKKVVSPETVPEHNVFEKAFEMKVAQKYESTKKSVDQVQGNLDKAKEIEGKVKEIPRNYSAQTPEQRDLKRKYEFYTNKQNKRFLDYWTSPSIRDPKINRLEALKATTEADKTAYRIEYIKKVKDYISKGFDISDEIVNQYPELKKAVDARARYEKGYKTSFANQSVAIDETTKANYGFKTKRQDGKAITPEQIKEITTASDELEQAIGGFKDIVEALDLTVAHTSGKFPFLRGDAGGLHIGGERLISIGIADVKAFAHEMMHVFDNASGTMSKGKSKHFAVGGEYDKALINKAREKMNGTAYQIDKAMKAKPDMDEYDKNQIKLMKARLSGYYRTDHEVFARLGEQYVAKKVGAKQASDAYEFYNEALGYWDDEIFSELEPLIEAQIKTKLELARKALGTKEAKAIKGETPKKIGMMDSDPSYTENMKALIKEAQEKGESFPFSKMSTEEQKILDDAFKKQLDNTPVNIPVDFKPYEATITTETIDVKKLSDPAYYKEVYESTFAVGGDKGLYKILTKELVPKDREASSFLADLYKKAKDDPQDFSVAKKETKTKKEKPTIADVAPEEIPLKPIDNLRLNPKYAEVEAQIFAEFDIAESGLKQTEEGYSRYSTFPKWIPEEIETGKFTKPTLKKNGKMSVPKRQVQKLRDSELMDKVLKHLDNGTEPKAIAVRERMLYNVIVEEIEARMGVMPDAYTPVVRDDAEMITEELLKAWDEDAQAMMNESIDDIHQTVSHVDIEGVHEVAKVLDTVPPIPKTPAKALKARKEQPNLNVFELPEQTRLQYIRQQIQDKFERLETTQKQITKAGNKIDEDADAMLQQELYVGRTAERIDTVRQSVIRDENGKGTGLLERMRKDGIKIEDLGRYLHAKHAGERNAKVATINEALPDGGSGLTNAEAQAILKEFEGNETIAKYADEFREKVIKERIRILREEDLMTEEALAKIETAYTNYVPLKVDMGDVQFGTRGKGFSAQGKDIKRVKGSDKTRYNPVIQAITDLEDTIIKAEKNKVGKSFLKLVRQNPNETLWTEEALKYVPQYDKNGEVVMLDPKYKFADNVMEVREGGKVRLITVKDKQLAQAMKNLGTEKAVSKVLMAFNSYLRGVVTFYNPEFMLTNVQRDIQTALINVGGEKSTKLAGLIAKDIAPAMRGIYRETRGKKPAIKSSTDWQAVYKEMKEEGGRVGWFDLNEVGDRTHETIKLIERYNSDQTVDSLRRGIDSIGKYVSDMNESVEMAVRVATYKHMVDSGVSKAESAKYAKNLTVNFNKKGNLGVALNSLYLFANAGIQGSFRIVTALKYPKVRAIVAGIAGSAYAYNHLNEAVNSEGYNRLSDTEKDTNLIFMLPPDFSPTDGERKILGGNDKDGYYLKLKLPYGYNVFKVLGDSAYNMTSGKKTVGEEMKHLLLALDASFNPLSSGSVLQFGSPTITDPIVQQMENKNWFGAPIKPDQPAYDQPVRESSLYFKGATEQSKAVTEWLNRVTGGNEVKAGFIDISPEIVDHYVDFIAGGVGSLFNATFDAGATLVKGDLPDLVEMPFVRKFIDKPFEQAEKFEMYDLLDESSTDILPKVKRDRFIESVKTALETEQIDDKTAKKVIKDFMTNEGRVKAGEIYTLYMEGNKEEALKQIEKADKFTEAEFKKLLKEKVKEKLEAKLKESAKATQN